MFFWAFFGFWSSSDFLLFLLYVLGAGLSGGAAGRLSMGKGTWNSWRELRGDERSEAPRSGWSNDMFFFIARANQESKGKVNYIAEAFL